MMMSRVLLMRACWALSLLCGCETSRVGGHTDAAAPLDGAADAHIADQLGDDGVQPRDSAADKPAPHDAASPEQAPPDVGAACIAPDDDGDGDAANDLQEILNQGDDLNLCPGQTYELTTNQCGDFSLCFTTDGQQIYTEGLPAADTGASAAVLKIAHPQVSSILVGAQALLSLKSVVFDGDRAAFGYVAGKPALVQMGLNGSDQTIEHNLFRNTRTWSTLQVHEGSKTCSGVVVAYNRIESAGCDKNGSGCNANDAVKTWADGISYACQNGSVHHNTIVNATDGGIVLFSPRGSQVFDNAITAVDRIMLGGINLVDDCTFRLSIDGLTYADYSGVQVHHNTIDASGARIDVGIAQGNRTWGCPPFENPLHGASVTDNTIQGAHLGWGAAIDGVHDWEFDRNTIAGTYNGDAKTGCEGASIPPPAACRKHAVHVTGASSAIEAQCADVGAGQSLHAILVSN